MAALSYYFGPGTKRHVAVSIDGSFVVFRCGMAGNLLRNVYPSRAEPNCRHCLRNQ